MTNDEAVKIVGKMMAQSITERMVQILLTACTREAELSAAAMLGKCLSIIGEYGADLTTRAEKNPKALGIVSAINQMLAAIKAEIRSLPPSGVLAEHDRQVRQKEAQWWWRYIDPNQSPIGIGVAKKHIAALRQPTAEKEKANE